MGFMMQLPDEGYTVESSEGTPQSRSYGWNIGFGLQAADGLEPSKYAYEVAQKNIQGDYTYEQAAQELEDYHAQVDKGERAGNRTREADLVAQRISLILQSDAFVLAPPQLLGIHKKLFEGILPQEWVGVLRTENITKAESVLGGQSVAYSDYGMVMPTLIYDFEQEKSRRRGYRASSRHEVVRSVARFISGIWQIHPFREGNTRTCAVYLIKYLNNLGFTLDDEPFAAHAREFRDALALANASREMRDDAPLDALMLSAVSY
jgi:fido (protein-threonine AMPylation protein)